MVLAAVRQLAGNGSVATASVRDVQRLTGLSRGAVSRALGRLRESGVLVLQRRAKHPHAADRYRIVQEPARQTDPLWSSMGLGEVAGMVFHGLGNGELWTVRQLADALDISASTIRGALLRLHSAGLVNGTRPGNDRNPRKTHWQLLDDAEHLRWVSNWLTADRQALRQRRIQQERFEYAQVWSLTDSRQQWDIRSSVVAV